MGHLFREGLVRMVVLLKGCSVEGCDRSHEARGLCKPHWKKWRRWGTPTPEKPNLLQRFWDKVHFGDCWTWSAGVQSQGYGVYDGGLAHRFAYVLLRGCINPGLELDHLCRNRACVNPDHLEPVTHQVNCIRAVEARRGP